MPRPLGHGEAFEHAQRPPLGVDAGHSPDARGDRDVLEDREAVVESGRLGEHAGAPAHGVAVGGGIEAEDAARAGVGLKDAIEQPDGGRLACAVGPEKGDHLTRGDLERQLVDGGPPRERPRQPAGLDRRVLHLTSVPCRARASAPDARPLRARGRARAAARARSAGATTARVEAEGGAAGAWLRRVRVPAAGPEPGPRAQVSG